MTPEQRKNVRIFLERWATIPPENVYPELNDWQKGRVRQKPTCGTIACAGGWMALMPEFQAMGIRPDPHSGAPTVAFGWFDATDFFGGHGLFSTRLDDERGTDHEVVTRRFKRLLRGKA